jgi:hypothetical protein
MLKFESHLKAAVHTKLPVNSKNRPSINKKKYDLSGWPNPWSKTPSEGLVLYDSSKILVVDLKGICCKGLHEVTWIDWGWSKLQNEAFATKHLTLSEIRTSHEGFLRAKLVST